MTTKLVISISDFQAQVADLLPSNNGKRSQLTRSLISSYSLLDKFDYIISKPISSKDELLKFHSSGYVDKLLDEQLNRTLPFDDDETSLIELNYLKTSWNADHFDDPHELRFIFETRAHLFQYFKSFSPGAEYNSRKRSFLNALEEEQHLSLVTDKVTSDTNDLQSYNLEGDCPLFSYLPMYCQVVAGASLMLADYINMSETSVAINWDGGRHHALKNKASGFCYVNDIVLLIQKLRKKGFQRITYVDFDLHHGDGVQKAFQYSSNIQTISLHLFEPGFFPCTGSLEDVKNGKSIVNIPLLHGLDDDFLHSLVNLIAIPLIENHKPEVLVLQCGGDGLIGDSFEEWQLTIRGLSECIICLMKKFSGCSIVLLGGGGYNATVMSRFYTYLTWKVLELYKNESLEPSFDGFTEHELIPDHEFTDQYADEYYKFWSYEQDGSLKKKILKNDNKTEYITELKKFYNI